MLTLTSCVGEIATTQKEVNIGDTRKNEITLSFSGVNSVVPISNDKIEVYFFPATGGSGDYSYQVYVGDNPTPYTGNEATMQKDYRGLFRLLVTQLNAGTTYLVKANATDIKKGTSIISDNTVTTTTFTNEVTNFFGISSVSNASGVDAVDSIIVKWVAADKDPSSPFGSLRDPTTYEIIAIDASLQSPAAANNYSLNEAQGRIIRNIEWVAGLNTSTVRGLKSNQDYYVFVRAIHRGSSNSVTIPSTRSELNNKYLSVKTLTSNASSINYDSNLFGANPSTGQQSLNTLNITLPPVTGVFDHIRLYYAKSNQLAGAESINTSSCIAMTATTIPSGQTACKKLSTISTTSTLSDLPALENYDIQMVICLNNSCSSYISNPNARCNALSPAPRCNARTEPTFANFNGIQTVESARDIREIGSMFLEYIPPSFTNGYFDGLVIEYTKDRTGLDNWLADETGNPKPETFILNADDYAGDLYVETYDLLEDGVIEISGVDYSIVEPQCFSLYPFVFDSEGNMNSSQATSLKRFWQCRTNQPHTPSAINFEGFGEALTRSSDVTLTWPRPLSGVFSHYEIFYRRSSGAGDNVFSFPDAITQTSNFNYTNYRRAYFSAQNPDGSDRLSHTIDELPDGRWIFGIQTHYISGASGVLRSEETQKLAVCNVVSTNELNIDCTILN